MMNNIFSEYYDAYRYIYTSTIRDSCACTAIVLDDKFRNEIINISGKYLNNLINENKIKKYPLEIFNLNMHCNMLSYSSPEEYDQKHPSIEKLMGQKYNLNLSGFGFLMDENKYITHIGALVKLVNSQFKTFEDGCLAHIPIAVANTNAIPYTKRAFVYGYNNIFLHHEMTVRGRVVDMNGGHQIIVVEDDDDDV